MYKEREREHRRPDLRKQIKENDNLIIFYAGHGWLNNSKGFIVPFDAKKGIEHTHISNIELNGQIEDANNLHTILILDSCHAGSFIKRTRGELSRRNLRLIRSS